MDNKKLNKIYSVGLLCGFFVLLLFIINVTNPTKDYDNDYCDLRVVADNTGIISPIYWDMFNNISDYLIKDNNTMITLDSGGTFQRGFIEASTNKWLTADCEYSGEIITDNYLRQVFTIRQNIDYEELQQWRESYPGYKVY